MLLELQPVDERLFTSWGMGFAAADAAGRDAFMRFGSSASFDPHAMSAGAALGLLYVLAPADDVVRMGTIDTLVDRLLDQRAAADVRDWLQSGG